MYYVAKITYALGSDHVLIEADSGPNAIRQVLDHPELWRTTVHEVKVWNIETLEELRLIEEADAAEEPPVFE